MIALPCEIVKCADGKGFWTYTPFAQTYLLNKRQMQCETVLTDGRTIRPKQRAHIYATLRDISAWSGYDPEETKAVMKYEYIAKTGCDYFSLSDCDVTTAREFLEYLIDFMLANDVGASGALLERCEDIQRYVYACVVHRKCCLTGRPADIHHVDAVGAGRDREEIVHKGMRVLPLCREKHEEMHAIGRDTFCEKYHVQPVTLDEYLCGILKLRSE